MNALMLFALWLGAYPQGNTIRIPARAGMDEITFDSRVSAHQVRRWIQLSDIVGGDNFYLVPETLEQCLVNDPAYEPCGKEDGGVNLHNAQHTLERIRTRISDLDPEHYPPDLKEVVLYVRRIQSFALWKETQRLTFLRTGDISALKSEFGGLNPEATCGAALDRIATAQSRAQAAAGLARVDWANCMWKAEMKQIGEYPHEAWEKFLGDHGIREHYIEEGPDD